MPHIFQSLTELEKLVETHPEPICLFSGGLDGAYLLARLSEISGVKPIAVTVDVGSEGDAARASEIAQYLGIEHVNLVERNRFSKEFVLPSLRHKLSTLEPIPSLLRSPGHFLLCAHLSSRRDGKKISLSIPQMHRKTVYDDLMGRSEVWVLKEFTERPMSVNPFRVRKKRPIFQGGA